MKVDLFDFVLPEELIASYPVSPRDSSRLMVVDREGSFTHTHFSSLPDFLPDGSILVFNDTKVIPARLFTVKQTGGRVELLLTSGSGNIWNSIYKASNRPKPGDLLTVIHDDGKTSDPIRVLPGDTGREIRLEFPSDGEIWDFLDVFGHIPLPPYIDRPDEASDRVTYQTVYAKNAGAVASPTAGLHFTPELLETIKSKGHIIATLTLHVGVGTFTPVKVEDTNDHVMHSEYYEIPESLKELIATADPSRKIISVGTTSARALEGAACGKRELISGSGNTNIFITPPYDFRIIDGLITNFHLPKSTLLMLVSALASRDTMLSAYNQAVEMKYRFFSYGDAMFIKPQKG